MAGLEPCRRCEKDIAKGVKKCRFCGKVQRNWFRKHKFLTFIGVLLLIGITSALGDEEGTSKKEKLYNVHNLVVIDEKAEVVVTKVEEVDKLGTQYIEKEVSDGYTFLAVQFTVKNISDEPIEFFSIPTFKLVDQKGTEYDADIDATSYYAVQKDLVKSKFSNDLNPNVKLTDVQVYVISKEAYAKGKWFLEFSGKERVKIK